MERNYSPRDLGARLKERLIKKNISQTEFANYLGFCRSYISMVIKGERQLTLDTLDKSCKILDTTIEYLMYGMEKEKCQKNLLKI